MRKRKHRKKSDTLSVPPCVHLSEIGTLIVGGGLLLVLTITKKKEKS